MAEHLSRSYAVAEARAMAAALADEEAAVWTELRAARERLEAVAARAEQIQAAQARSPRASNVGFAQPQQEHRAALLAAPQSEVAYTASSGPPLRNRPQAAPTMLAGATAKERLAAFLDEDLADLAAWQPDAAGLALPQLS